jgi:hypothetical protein
MVKKGNCANFLCPPRIDSTMLAIRLICLLGVLLIVSINGCGGGGGNSENAQSSNETSIGYADSYTVSKGSATSYPAPGVLANDYAVNNGTLQAQIATNAARGNVTLESNGAFSYVPNLNFDGLDKFTYVIIDGEFISDPIDVVLSLQNLSIVSSDNWNLDGYIDAIDVMEAADLLEIYDGSGTAVVKFENKVVFLNAEFTDPTTKQPNGEMVFGDCMHISAPIGGSDMRGWAPGGDCKVAWVMCFEVPQGSDANDPMRGVRAPCTVEDPDRYHSTSVGNGLASVSPGAKIIAIKIKNNMGEAFKHAVDWLLQPSSDYDWYLANGYTPDEASYYNDTFNGLSPAEFWNVVATSASISTIIASFDNPLMLGVFSRQCTFAPNPEPELGPDSHEYLLDWHAENIGYLPEIFMKAWGDYEPSIKRLKNNNIMPFFASDNFLWQDPNDHSHKFVTPGGVAYPACLADSFAVSGVASFYNDITIYGRQHYIGSNAHPTMTDFVSPAGSATSLSTPVVAASAAVLKSSNLAPDADIDAIVNYLKQSALPEASSGFSCENRNSETHPPAPFPANAHPSLDCSGTPPYTLPVLHLGEAINSAIADQIN